MKILTAFPVLAALTLAAPAFAQDAPPPPAKAAKPNGEWRAAHHAEHCTNIYAGAVGKLAALEVKLTLTASQKPLYARWQKVMLENAKKHADKCTAMTPPADKPSIMEGFDRRTAMMEDRLAALKAEKPSLQALVESLSPEQQKIFARAAAHAMHDRMGKMGRHDGMGPHGPGMGPGKGMGPGDGPGNGGPAD